uniref:Uncharacterized protein n=1 Tax=Arion vulgaris TaxID=1028688 RepID=A0A0B7BUD0_9EUPU
MRNVKEAVNKEQYSAVVIGSHALPEIRYADDAVFLSISQNGIEKLIMPIHRNNEK